MEGIYAMRGGHLRLHHFHRRLERVGSIFKEKKKIVTRSSSSNCTH